MSRVADQRVGLWTPAELQLCSSSRLVTTLDAMNRTMLRRLGGGAWRWLGHASLAHWLVITLGLGGTAASCLALLADVRWPVYTGVVSLAASACGIGLQRTERHRRLELAKAANQASTTEAVAPSRRVSSGERGRVVDVDITRTVGSSSVPEAIVLREELRRGLALRRCVTDYLAVAPKVYLYEADLRETTDVDVARWEDRVADLLTSHPLKQQRFMLEPRVPLFGVRASMAALENPLARLLDHRLQALEEIIQELDARAAV